VVVTRDCRYGKMAFNDKDIYQGASLAKYGEYSELEVGLFREFVKPGAWVLDVGACYGSHTVALGRLAGPDGRVFAFEPERRAFYCLCTNIALNNLDRSVYAFQQLVSKERGVQKVPEIDTDQANNFGGMEYDNVAADCAGYPVEVTTLDSFGFPRCDFIKIDVEGMEESVLMGARELIAKYKPVLYVEDDREEKSAALHKLIRDLGYEFRVHCPPLYNPQNFSGDSENIFGSTVSINLLCMSR
jgi:FkbM family methyltransferase